MGINLKKGQTIDLRKNLNGKNAFNLSKITLGLGWDIQNGSSFSGNKKDANNSNFDLDAIAFLLDKNNSIEKPKRGDIIFYNNMTYPSISRTSDSLFQGMSKKQMEQKVQDLLNQGEVIVHTGDNLTGEGKEGDKESIILKLEDIPSRIHRIVLLVCIFNGVNNKQHFGQVKNAYIRICDTFGHEIAKYDLSNSSELNGKCSLEFAELYRKDGVWNFGALGKFHQTDTFLEIANNYMSNK
jgi:tellurium resistance protein TerD